MLKPLDIIIVPSNTIYDMNSRPIPKNRPFIVLATSTSVLKNVRPVPGTIAILMGTTVLDKAARDGVIIHPEEVEVFNHFNFKYTLFRKEEIFYVPEQFANSLNLVARVKSQDAKNIIVALEKFL